MRPKPMTPRSAPLTSCPRRYSGSHPANRPARTSRSPSHRLRAAASISPMAQSAVAFVSTPGVLATTTPRPVAASTSTLLNPTAKSETQRRRDPPASSTMPSTDSRSCGHSTSTGRSRSSDTSSSRDMRWPAVRNVAASLTSAGKGFGRASVHRTSGATAADGKCLRSPGIGYSQCVLRSSSRMRFGRPHVARPRPAEIVAVDGAATEIPEAVSFDGLRLSPAMRHTVAELGFEAPTPIQAGAIPPALAGRDVIGQAHTGSGKTAAFGIPIIERLDPAAGFVQALVLCPTRELAVQVYDELTRLASRHEVRSLAVYGGDSIGRQMQELRRGVHIIVATPGRLRDHLQRRSMSLDNVRWAILDEADRMLDMGFAPDVERILRECPAERQTMLFSATMPQWVRRIAARHMRNPVTVEISVRPEIVAGVRQLYLQTTWAAKTDALARILDQPNVTMALIFVETKRTADVLQVQLQRRGYQVGLLHGDLTQRDRDQAMRQFRANHVRFLIATNVAARGLDIDDISHVINYDVPLTPDEYLHRVGRTARAGRLGVAVTLITPSEILKLRDVERHAHTVIEPASNDEFPAAAAAGGA